LSRAAAAQHGKFSLKTNSLEPNLPRLQALRRKLIPMYLDGEREIPAYIAQPAAAIFLKNEIAPT